jgi:hypothetical protein
MSSSADRDGIDGALALATSLAKEIGQPFLTWVVTNVRCTHILLMGDADEAERLADAALRIGNESGQPDAFMAFGTNLAGIRWHQGRVDELLPLLSQAATDGPELPALESAYTATLCECGCVDEARPLFDAARATDFHQAAYDWIWLAMTALWADTAVWLGDADAAAVLYERLAPFEAQGITTGANFNGTVGLYLARLAALLGRDDDAIRRFERTDAQLRALGAPFWQARNQVEWARLLLARGTDADLERARQLLAEAATTAVAHGCRGIERRAQELASAVSGNACDVSRRPGTPLGASSSSHSLVECVVLRPCHRRP